MQDRARGTAGSAWLRRLGLLVPLLAAGCAGLGRDDQGALQPQTVRGPCQVKKFFVLGLRAVPTTLTVGNAGEACTLTLFNPDLQLSLAAALVTGQPAHGRATAGVVNGGRQVAVSYAPQPGYVGADRFSITIEPNAFGVVFSVSARAEAPAT